MDNLTNMIDFITSALPCIAGVIIGEVIVKVWENITVTKSHKSK